MNRFNWFAVGVLLCVGAVSGRAEVVTVSTTDGPLPCYIYDFEYFPPGTRILIAGHHGKTQEIQEPERTFVGHGWGGPALSCVEGIPLAELAQSLFDVLQFSLTVNGAHLVPDYLVMHIVGGEDDPHWGTRRFYEFAPGTFPAGLHIVAGTWSIEGFPCAWEAGGCAEIAADGVEATFVDEIWYVPAATKVLTVVSYP